MNGSVAIQVEQVTILLTLDQIIAAVRQLGEGERTQVMQALQKGEPAATEGYQLSMAALNSPVAEAVWDNPADAAAYDAIPWEREDALATR